MAPTLIVLGLLLLGVAIVVWATRRKPGLPRVVRHEQDVVWNDPVGVQTGSAATTPPLLTPPSILPSRDPFAGAPPASTTEPRP